MLCGIDEAGRGPLAGPLVFAGVILKESIEGLNDSKKLSEKKREALYNTIIQNSYHHIVFCSAKKIDEVGLSICIKESIEEIKSTLSIATRFIFDGNSEFGVSGIETLVKADESIPEVSAASILAKVSRDRFMVKQDLNYPQYSFGKHKGYGTKAHIEAIKEHGLTELHRKSFRLKS
jgi:ribonuclease HII